MQQDQQVKMFAKAFKALVKSHAVQISGNLTVTFESGHSFKAKGKTLGGNDA